MALPDALLEVLSQAIPLMAVADGYSQDYGPINVRRPSQWQLPQVMVSLGREAPRQGQRLGALETNLPLVLRVICPAPVAPADIQSVCDGITQDFKRLLHAFEGMQQIRNLGLLRADFMSAETAYRLVTAAPAELTITYSIWCRQMKTTF